MYEQGRTSLRIDVYKERGLYMNTVRELHMQMFFDNIFVQVRSSGFIQPAQHENADLRKNKDCVNLLKVV